MGLECSKLGDLEGNPYLRRFASTEVINANDPIWNKLFSHSMRPVFSKGDAFLLDSALDNIRTLLLSNNPHTHNVSALLTVFISRADELESSVTTSDTLFLWQAYNALFMIRNVLKLLVESLDEAGFVSQFAQAEGSEDGVIELLVECLVRKVVISLPLQPSTYLLHLEAVNTLLTLLSCQMFWGKPAAKLGPFRVMMAGAPAQSSSALARTLLQNYVEQREPPYSIWHSEESGSIVIGVASGLWNMLRKGVGLAKTEDSLEGLKDHNLANQSLYLLLTLVNHCTRTGTFNPYREALITFGNEAVTNDPDDSSLSVDAPLFKLSYSKLYDTMCERISNDETTLLLYFLLHRNHAFRSYVMARSDIEQLVLPILKTLYNAPTSTSYHIYMSLIIMLILSEDQLFNQQVHDITLKSVPFYTERRLSDVSLGGLIILVIIRTIQYNILKMRDKYLHTNCLAALANMSSKFRGLHPYVSQRLISVFETLAKRHSKLVEGLEKESGLEGTSRGRDERSSELVQDISVLEEVIRMLLEILNSVFTHQLPQNRHLLYSLLYKKEVFEAFREYDTTQDLVYNLDIVINYFTKRIGPDSAELGVSEVMERIEEGVRHWTPDVLRKFPDLKFRYVEEDQPENFFIPYVWSLIHRNSGLYWSPLNLSLFTLDGEFA